MANDKVHRAAASEFRIQINRERRLRWNGLLAAMIDLVAHAMAERVASGLRAMKHKPDAFVFIDGMPTDFLSPYISLGIRW